MLRKICFSFKTWSESQLTDSDCYRTVGFFTVLRQSWCFFFKVSLVIAVIGKQAYQRGTTHLERQSTIGQALHQAEATHEVLRLLHATLKRAVEQLRACGVLDTTVRAKALSIALHQTEVQLGAHWHARRLAPHRQQQTDTRNLRGHSSRAHPRAQHQGLVWQNRNLFPGRPNFMFLFLFFWLNWW